MMLFCFWAFSISYDALFQRKRTYYCHEELSVILLSGVGDLVPFLFEEERGVVDEAWSPVVAFFLFFGFAVVGSKGGIVVGNNEQLVAYL